MKHDLEDLKPCFSLKSIIVGGCFIIFLGWLSVQILITLSGVVFYELFRLVLKIFGVHL